MTRRRTSPRKIVDFEQLLAADAELCKQDAFWRGAGYQRVGARLWRRRDGNITARLVWRNRAAAVSTVTYTVQWVVQQ